MAQRAATIAEVRFALGPNYTDPPITDVVVQTYLDQTACFIAPSVWGECASEAHAQAAAHCVAKSPYANGIPIPEGFGPVIAGEADGGASRSFSVPAAPDGAGPWYLSGWGRKFLEYRLQRWGRGSAVVARTGLTARSRAAC